jgi:hypothetical protein
MLLLYGDFVFVFIDYNLNCSFMETDGIVINVLLWQYHSQAPSGSFSIDIFELCYTVA